MRTSPLNVSSIQQFCSQYGKNRTFWIAYSGGLDSHVLLSLFTSLKEELTLSIRAIHINHQLSPHAADWARHCASVCHAYGIDLIEKRLNLLQAKGASLEEVAREARYDTFAEILGDGDILVTAHHQDDQAETIFLQLIRGAGLKGLAAMPVLKPLGKGFHGRPLLDFTREELFEYAKQQNLNWIQDESNQNINFSRNFLRNEVFPILKSRWPGIAETFSRSAAHCAEAQNLLDQQARSQLKLLEGDTPHTLSVKKLLELNVPQQRLMLRAWIHTKGMPLPNAKKIETICQTILLARVDRMPHISWKQTELRRFKDNLYLLRHLENLPEPIVWNFKQTLHLTGLGYLKASQTLGRGLKVGLKEVLVRFREGGESIRLAGRGRQFLKNLFQENSIPPWERNRIPLLFAGSKLVAVAGFFIDEHYAAKEDEEGVELEFTKSN